MSGKQTFFMGGLPTTLDATAYRYIGTFLQPRFESPIVDYLLERSNLCQHYERMTQQFFANSALERQRCEAEIAC